MIPTISPVVVKAPATVRAGIRLKIPSNIFLKTVAIPRLRRMSNAEDSNRKPEITIRSGSGRSDIQSATPMISSINHIKTGMVGQSNTSARYLTAVPKRSSMVPKTDECWTIANIPVRAPPTRRRAYLYLPRNASVRDPTFWVSPTRSFNRSCPITAACRFVM